MATGGYLVLTRAAWAELRPDALAAVLRGSGVRSVLFCDVTTVAAAKLLAPLIAAVQSADIAALVDDVALATSLNADGVHLAFLDDVNAAAGALSLARQALGKSLIVGADAGGSRHHAMVLGELGADYIAIADPDDARQLATVGWWAELFESPVVAWDVGDAAAARSLVAAGADFIAVTASIAGNVDGVIADLTAWLEARL